MADDTRILTDLELDDPIELDGNFRFGEHDRRFMDNQMLGGQQHLVDCVIGGAHCTYYLVDGASPALQTGDVVCLIGGGTSRPLVTKALTTPLAHAGNVIVGIVMKAAAPGSKVLVAIAGALSPSVTGLDPSTNGFVIVDPSIGRVTWTSLVGAADIVVGTVTGGWLEINARANGAAIPASVALTGDLIDWSTGFVFYRDLPLGSHTFIFQNVTDGQTITARLKGNAGGSTVTWPTIKWAGGTPPTQTSTGIDVYTFVSINGSIYGSVVQNMS